MTSRFLKHACSFYSRILAASALILEFVLDVVAVAAGHHGKLGMRQRSFTSVQLPEVPVAVPHAVNQPGGGVAHLVNQRVPETIWKVARIRGVDLKI